MQFICTTNFTYDLLAQRKYAYAYVISDDMENFINSLDPELLVNLRAGRIINSLHTGVSKETLYDRIVEKI